MNQIAPSFPKSGARKVLLQRAASNIVTATTVMSSEIMRIGPAQAKELLARNTSNRPINRGTVEEYAGAMKRGEWLLTHQGVALDPDLNLLDGQHRLMAIIIADVEVEMMVTFDCAPEAFAMLDRGRVRSLAYALRTTEAEVSTTRLALAVMSGLKQNGFRFSTGQVQAALPVIQPRVQKLKEHCKAVAKQRTSAPVHLGLIALMIKYPAMQEDLGRLFRAFVLLETDNMPRSVGQLLRQIDEKKTSARQAIDMLARVWTAFDPKNFELKKIQITSLDTQLAEIKTELKKIWPQQGIAA